MRALVCFGLDGAASLYSHDDDGAGLVLTCGPECAAPTLQPRAPSTLRKKPPSAPREKPPSALFKSETDAKANEKVTLCNNFAQLSLKSQQ